mmetsp:Transcript_14551/g.20427  ORF Transcript_14551/g.20427 Transcript_14551/m.20427 type:complete len:491 (-) Transcript_14551:158-1630(-)
MKALMHSVTTTEDVGGTVVESISKTSFDLKDTLKTALLAMMPRSKNIAKYRSSGIYSDDKAGVSSLTCNTSSSSRISISENNGSSPSLITERSHLGAPGSNITINSAPILDKITVQPLEMNETSVTTTNNSRSIHNSISIGSSMMNNENIETNDEGEEKKEDQKPLVIIDASSTSSSPIPPTTHMATPQLANRHHLTGGITSHVTFLPNKQQTTRLVHIPKTAGYSVLTDVRGYMKMFESEDCARSNVCPQCGAYKMIYLRDPRKHVLSQFFECTYGHAKAWTSVDKRFPKFHDVRRVDPKLSTAEQTRLDMLAFDKWLDYFSPGSWNVRDGHLGCYHPRNMQARYMVCERRGWMNSHGVQSPHLLEPNISRAKAFLNSTFMLGLVEEYGLSLCVIAFQARQGSLPGWCSCEPTAPKPPSFARVLHGAPVHSLRNARNESLAKIDKLVRVDLELYAYAEQLFWARVEDVEARTGKDLSCLARRKLTPTKY